ncbi:MAG: response regulator, partial [Thiomicrorhabdus sp.]|nr:response regulator [Thiomicrorhabdus sp.]
GEIGVTSELNKGSCFWMKLPFENLSVKPIDAEQPSVSPEFVPSLEPNQPLAGKNILLVEDNVINQNVIDAFLKRLGAKVDIADNGLKGLDYWRLSPQRYQLIIMDCQMPVMDGFEATKMIRKEEEVSDNVRHIPILALTANVMVQDKQRCLQAGMDDFLAKPIDKATFNRLVIQWCL